MRLSHGVCGSEYTARCVVSDYGSEFANLFKVCGLIEGVLLVEGVRLGVYGSVYVAQQCVAQSVRLDVRLGFRCAAPCAASVYGSVSPLVHGSATSLSASQLSSSLTSN